MCVMKKPEGRLVGRVVGVEGSALQVWEAESGAREVWEGYESRPRGGP